MKTVPATQRKKVHYKTLDARQKATAALETLRGARSVAEIARHWQVDPAELLKWQCTLVERANSLFEPDAEDACTKLLQARMLNEAMITTMFEHIDAREALQQSEARLHRLLAYQDQVKEEERKRIAQEIHDALGQNLLAIRIDISMLEERTRMHHPQIHQRAGVVLSNVDSAIQAVRSMINDLRPFELELGLAAAVQWQVNRFQRMTGIATHFVLDRRHDDAILLDEKVTLAIFRTLQEAMSNVSRYAQVSKVIVKLNFNARGVLLIIEDNGMGMAQGTAASAGLGLASMGERLKQLGGEMTLETQAGGGTRFRSWIPLSVGGLENA